MKRKHVWKLDDSHKVIVYKTNSPSNYNLFVTVVANKNKKQALTGTTRKETDKKEDIISWAKISLKLYLSDLKKNKIITPKNFIHFI